MVLELNALLNKYALAEPDYQKIKAFFEGDRSFRQLNKLQQSVIDAIDHPKINLPIDVLEKVEVLKTRLIAENVLTETHMNSLERSSFLYNKISSGKDFHFADVKTVDVDAIWQRRLDEMFAASKSQLPLDIQKLPLAQQQKQFRESLIEELKISDTELAKQWRSDYNVKSSKPDFIDELFEKGRGEFTAELKALPEVEQRALFRKTFVEMADDPNAIIVPDSLRAKPRGGKRRNPGRPDYLLDDDGGDGVSGVKVSGGRRTSPLIQQSEIDRAKIQEARGPKAKPSVEMQNLGKKRFGDFVSIDDVMGEKASEIPFERYSNNKRIKPFGTRSGPLVVELDNMSAEPIFQELSQLDDTFEWTEIAGQKMLKVGTWGLKTLTIGAMWSTFFAQFNNVIKNPDVSLYLAIGASVMESLVLKDPTSAIVMGISVGVSKMIEEFARQRQRAMLNYHPQDVLGSRFGKIRVNGKFYPCFLSARYTDPGFGSRSDTISIVYGTGLHWVKDKDGTIRPEFAWEKRKTLKSSDDFVTGDKNTGREKQKEDPLRDFYFLSEAETQKLFEDPQYRSKWETVEIDQVSDYNIKNESNRKYLANLLELKKILDITQTETSSRRQDVGAVADTGFATAGIYAEGKAYWVQQGIPLGLGNFVPIGDLSSEVSWQNLGENKFLLKETLKHLTLLSKTQKEAAAQAGFAKGGGRHYVENVRDSDNIVGSAIAEKYQFQDKSYLNVDEPYRAYLDLGRSLPVAKTSTELEEQFKTISSYTDRTPEQKNYLTQKAISRALMFQVNERGGGNDLYHQLGAKGPVLGVNEGGWEFNKHRSHTYDQSAKGLLAWEQDEKSYLPAWYSKDDVSMLPRFMDYLSKDRDTMTKLYRDITKNSKKLGSQSPYGFKKTDSTWNVNFTGTGAPLKPKGKIDPKFRGINAPGEGQYFRETEESETAAEKKTRLKKEKELRLHPKKALTFKQKQEADRLEKARIASGMTQTRWDMWMKNHGGMTPEEVERTGRYGRGLHISHDITDKNDPYYKGDPNTKYDIIAKRWVPKTTQRDISSHEDPFYKADPTTMWDYVSSKWVPVLGPKKPPPVKTETFQDKFGPQKEFGSKKIGQYEQWLAANTDVSYKKWIEEKRVKKKPQHGEDYHTFGKKTPQITDPIAPGVTLHQTDIQHNHPHYGAVKSWLVEQLGLQENINVHTLDPKKYPTLSFDSHNHVTLFDDVEVHKKFGISSKYTAVTDQLGHLHTMYQARRVVPKFQSAKPVALSQHIPSQHIPPQRIKSV